MSHWTGMTLVRGNLKTLSCFAALAICAACSSDSEEPQQVAVPTRTVKKEKAPEDPTAKMARAVTQNNPKVPVELKYDIPSRPTTNTPIDIELAVLPISGADSISVAFSASPGLNLSADSAPEISAVKAGQVERVKLTGVAKDIGVYYVTVTLTMYSAGISQPKTFALPIITSAPLPEPVPAASDGASKSPKKS